MAVFIPEIWSQKVLADTKPKLVGEQICNQNWYGDIKGKGSKVHIMSAGSVTAKTYTRDNDIDAPEVPADTDTELVIDQSKYVNFGIDDLDKVQSNLKRMGIYTSKAVLALRKVLDTFIMGKYTDAHADNIVTNGYVPITSSNVYSVFNSMFKKLTDKEVELTERWSVIDSAIMKIINAHLAGKATSLGDAVTINGFVGKFAGFNMYLSHNVVSIDNTTTTWAVATAYALGDKVIPTTPNTYWYECTTAGTSHAATEPTWKTTEGETNTDGTAVWTCKNGDANHKIMCGHNDGITLAYQIPVAKIKYYEPEKRFGEAVKMLCYYGAKVLDSGRRIGYIDAPIDA